jgi:hypothetical protein
MNPASVRSNFAIAKLGRASYSWQALKSASPQNDAGGKQATFAWSITYNLS